MAKDVFTEYMELITGYDPKLLAIPELNRKYKRLQEEITAAILKNLEETYNIGIPSIKDERTEFFKENGVKEELRYLTINPVNMKELLTEVKASVGTHCVVKEKRLLGMIEMNNVAWDRVEHSIMEGIMRYRVSNPCIYNTCKKKSMYFRNENIARKLILSLKEQMGPSRFIEFFLMFTIITYFIKKNPLKTIKRYNIDIDEFIHYATGMIDKRGIKSKVNLFTSQGCKDLESIERCITSTLDFLIIKKKMERKLKGKGPDKSLEKIEEKSVDRSVEK